MPVKKVFWIMLLYFNILNSEEYPHERIRAGAGDSCGSGGVELNAEGGKSSGMATPKTDKDVKK